jgi:DNA (cytosine-5)-methyltransferase 1
MPAVTAQGNHLALAQPFLMHLTHGGREHDIDAPMPTVTSANRGELGVVQPFIVPFYGEREGQTPRTHSVDEPMPVVAGTRTHGVVQPFILGQQSGSVARSTERPLPTVSTGGALAMVQPFLTVYNGESGAVSVEEPMPTVTSADRFALVQPTVNGQVLDIHFRMLQPGELAGAQGFKTGYRFTGNKTEQVEQIGNAVPVNLATALCRAALED